MNSKKYQRFSFQKKYNRSFSNKCLYCYQKNYLFKKQCKNFQNDLIFEKIHTLNKKIYFEYFQFEALLVRM